MRSTEHETLQQARFIQDVAKALDVIFTSVERQTQEIATVNQMATQHWRSAQRIAQIMPHISNTTQNNNRNIAMAVQHVMSLSQRVDLLRVSVGAFKVHGDQKSSPGVISTPSRNLMMGRWRQNSRLLDPKVTGALSHSGTTLPPSIHPQWSS